MMNSDSWQTVNYFKYEMPHKHLPKYNTEGDAHFITTKTHINTPLFKVHSCAIIVLEELAFYRKQKGFKVLGYVVMPNHFHGIIWWDAETKRELTISKIMQSFKGSVARRIVDEMFQEGSVKHQPRSLESKLHAYRRKLTLSTTRRQMETMRSHRRGLQYKIWQTSFYDFNIVSERKLWEKLNYIHNNPMKAGLCSSAEEYSFSSAWFYAGMEKPKGLERVICPVDEI